MSSSLAISILTLLVLALALLGVASLNDRLTKLNARVVALEGGKTLDELRFAPDVAPKGASIIVSAGCEACDRALSVLVSRTETGSLNVIADRHKENWESRFPEIQPIIVQDVFDFTGVPAVPWFIVVGDDRAIQHSFSLGTEHQHDSAVRIVKEGKDGQDRESANR